MAGDSTDETATDGEREPPATDGDESRKVARPTAVPLASLGLAVSDRIEVCWEVEMTDGSEESVWWAAAIVSGGGAEGAGGEAGGDEEPVLEYEAQHGA